MDRETKESLSNMARDGDTTAFKAWIAENKDSEQLLELNNLFDNSWLIELADKGHLTFIKSLLSNGVTLKAESTTSTSRIYPKDLVADDLVYTIKMIGSRLKHIYDGYHSLAGTMVAHNLETRALALKQMDCFLQLSNVACNIEYYGCGVNAGKTFLEHAVLDGESRVVRMILKHEKRCGDLRIVVKKESFLGTILEGSTSDESDEEYALSRSSMVRFSGAGKSTETEEGKTDVKITETYGT